MSRHRAHLSNWTYNEQAQEIHTPAGQTITLQEIAQRLHDDAACRYDFGGAWSGWKMRGTRLIPPHCGKAAAAITPRTGPNLLRWIEAAKSGFRGG